SSTDKPPPTLELLVVERVLMAAVRVAFTYLRTSSWVILCFSPVPFTCARSTPSSRANLRTEGEAWGKLRLGIMVDAKEAVGETLNSEGTVAVSSMRSEL